MSSAVAQVQPQARTVTAWLLMPPISDDIGSASALESHGWQVTRVAPSVRGTLQALSKADPKPDVLIMGLQFPDGDALYLIRRLADLTRTPALFFVSSQPPAVIKAVCALGRRLGLTVIGYADTLKRGADLLRPMTQQIGSMRRIAAPPPAPPTPEAVERLIDLGRIQVFVQPKMQIDDCRVTGFESLVRAIDDDGSVLAPQRLLQPLVDTGRLGDVTLLIIQHTVDFLHECLIEAMPVGASVNIPLHLISDQAFCWHLVDAVERAKLDPSQLTIEITETEAMSDVATVIENTARIRMLGFNLSIDDFGTAYSSFEQLIQIPFSELKIERSFVTGISGDTARQAVVGACASLGGRLGLGVVAEGVESRADLEAVREAGCTLAQGYLISRPMSVQAALDWLRRLRNDDLRLNLCGTGASAVPR